MEISPLDHLTAPTNEVSAIDPRRGTRRKAGVQMEVISMKAFFAFSCSGGIEVKSKIKSKVLWGVCSLLAALIYRSLLRQN